MAFSGTAFDVSDHNAKLGVMLTCDICETSRFFEVAEFEGGESNRINDFHYEDSLGDWAIVKTGSPWYEGHISSRCSTLCPACFEKFKRTLTKGGFDTLVDFGYYADKQIIGKPSK